MTRQPHIRTVADDTKELLLAQIDDAIRLLVEWKLASAAGIRRHVEDVLEVVEPLPPGDQLTTRFKFDDDDEEER